MSTKLWTSARPAGDGACGTGSTGNLPHCHPKCPREDGQSISGAFITPQSPRSSAFVDCRRFNDLSQVNAVRQGFAFRYQKYHVLALTSGVSPLLGAYQGRHSNWLAYDFLTFGVVDPARAGQPSSTWWGKGRARPYGCGAFLGQAEHRPLDSSRWHYRWALSSGRSRSPES